MTPSPSHSHGDHHPLGFSSPLSSPSLEPAIQPADTTWPVTSHSHSALNNDSPDGAFHAGSATDIGSPTVQGQLPSAIYQHGLASLPTIQGHWPSAVYEPHDWPPGVSGALPTAILEGDTPAVGRVARDGSTVHRTAPAALQTAASHGANSASRSAAAPAARSGSGEHRGLSGSASGIKTLPGSASGLQRFPQVPGYEVQGVLGQGGMGIVYKARHVGLDRLVALKMIRAGADLDDGDLLRFRSEGQAVARLAHPNIVGVYDVGEHSGRPYIALEFVGAGTLSSRLRGRPQPAKPSAALVATLAEAMHVAHQAGIIHRDLKPSNVLFTEDGRPKISDFGLAKRIDTADPAEIAANRRGGSGSARAKSSGSAVTRTGIAMGTPNYMAPEQVEDASRVGPLADVYALGAMLYELLTGRPPFVGESEINTIWMVISQDPVSLRQLVPRVSRDLETIAHKCLDKDPRRRYPSAAHLAADLRRYLAGQSITARPAGTIEKAIKWMGRNPGAAAAVGLFVVAFVAVTSLLGVVAQQKQQSESLRREAETQAELARSHARTAETRAAEAQAQRSEAEAQRREAQTQRSEAEAQRQRAVDAAQQAEARRLDAEANLKSARDNFALARKAIAECLDLARNHPAFQRDGLQEARSVLLRVATGYHERLSQASSERDDRLGDTNAVRRELAKSRYHAGAAAGELGDKSAAVEAYRRAISELETLPRSVDQQMELASCYNNLGVVLAEQSRSRDAVEQYKKAFAIWRELMTTHPAQAEAWLRQTAMVANNLGVEASRLGEHSEALKFHIQSRDIRADLLRRSPQNVAVKADLGTAQSNLAYLLWQTGRAAEALPEFRSTIKLMREVVAARPDDRTARRDLGLAYNNVAALLEQLGRWPEAAEDMVRALAIRRELCQSNPAVVGLAADLGMTHHNYAYLLLQMGRLDEAIDNYRAAINVRRRVLDMAPNVPDYRHRLSESLGDLGTALESTGRLAEALASFEAARELRQRLLADAPNHFEFLHSLGLLHNNIGTAMLKLDRRGDAVRELREGCRILELAARQQPQIVSYRQAAISAHLNMADALAEGGRASSANLTAAVDEFTTALKAAEQAMADLPSSVELASLATQIRASRTTLLLFTGQADLALAEARLTVETAARLARLHTGSIPLLDRHADALVLLSVCLDRSDQLPAQAEALEHLAQAVDLRRRLCELQPDSAARRMALAETLSSLGNALYRGGRRDQALQHLRESVDLYDALAAAHPNTPAYRDGATKARDSLTNGPPPRTPLPKPADAPRL